VFALFPYIKLAVVVSLGENVKMKKIDKIRALLNALAEIHDVQGKIKIIRLDLRRLIGGKLTIVDRHTVSGWINYLLAKHFIQLNPTSETIRVESNPYAKCGGLYPKTKMIMPNNETRYVINIHQIKCFLKEHITHTPTNFTKPLL